MRAGTVLDFVTAAMLVLAGPAAAADWNVVAAKSRLGFEGTAAGVPFEGRFNRWQARISFDAAAPDAARATVTVDMGSAETGDPQKDAGLPQSEWFDAKTFPAATFEAHSFRAMGGHAYEAAGSLRIRDVKKDVVVPLSIEVEGDSLHASGRFEFERTDYGVGQGSWRSGQWVALHVAATFDVTAERVR